MDCDFLGAHHPPAALGFYAAHTGVSPRPGIPHPIAVGHLVEAILGDHGTDFHRFKEDVEARVTGHVSNSSCTSYVVQYPKLCRFCPASPADNCQISGGGGLAGPLLFLRKRGRARAGGRPPTPTGDGVFYFWFCVVVASLLGWFRNGRNLGH